MRSPELGLRFVCAVALSAVAACGGVVDPATSASTNEPQPIREPPRAAASGVADGSLAALTAEVRQLRAAVEDLARSQSETQALGVHLSVQQGRVQQIDQQLAALRREIDSATAAKQGIDGQIPNLLAEQARMAPDQRGGMEAMLNGLRAEQTRLDLELQHFRSRESELSQTLRSEEARWNALIKRLEALAR